jgi:hypothetical protein
MSPSDPINVIRKFIFNLYPDWKPKSLKWNVAPSLRFIQAMSLAETNDLSKEDCSDFRNELCEFDDLKVGDLTRFFETGNRTLRRLTIGLIALCLANI